jgi:hypothetical protein
VLERKGEFFNANSETLNGYKTWVSLLIDVPKITVIFSTPIGLLLIGAYLLSERAPLPVADASTATSLIFVVAVYTFAASLIFLAAFAPVVTCYVPLKERRRVLSERIRGTMRSKSWRKKIGSQYLIFQSGPYGVIGAFLIMVIWDPPHAATSTAIFLSLIFIGSMCGSVYSAVRYLRVSSLNVRGTASRAKLFRHAVARRVFFGGLLRAAMTFLWVLGLFLVISSIFANNMKEVAPSYLKYMFVGFLVIAFVVHFFLTSIHVLIKRIPLSFLFMAVAFCLYYPAYIGAKTLRLMGIGGGIPVLLHIRSGSPVLQAAEQREVAGCLILNIGSQIIIRPTLAPPPVQCDHANTLVPQARANSEGSARPMYSGISLIPSTQVVLIQGYE